MIFSRAFAQPNKDTFDCPPIGAFVRRYLRESTVSVDCFARNRRWATYTNDLNPRVAAEYHLDVYDFLETLSEQGVVADLMIFDPPFSPTQLKVSYEEVGLKFTFQDAWRTGGWSKEKKLANSLLKLGGVFLNFGWNTNGINGANDGGYVLEEILLVNHGAAHSDTICMAERKVDGQLDLFQ